MFQNTNKSTKPELAIIIKHRKNIELIPIGKSKLESEIDIRWLYFDEVGQLRPCHSEEDKLLIPLLKSDKKWQITLEKALKKKEQFYNNNILILKEDKIYSESEILQTILEYKKPQVSNLKPQTTALSGVEVSSLKPPLVSVIIPTYKRNASLKKAILSVIDQTYKNIEIIIIDDNEPNSIERLETKAIIAELKNEKRIIYLAHDKNRNGAAARNTGIFNSNGQYISFLDDDDIYFPKKIEKQIKALLELENNDSENKFGAVYCGYLGWNSNKNDLTRYLEKDFTYEIFTLDYIKHYIHTNTVLYKKEALLKINGFDESFKRHQDLELNLRFFKYFKMGFVKDVLVHLTPVETNINNQVKNISFYNLKFKYLEKFRETISKFSTTQQTEIYLKNWKEVISTFQKKQDFVDYALSLAGREDLKLLVSEYKEDKTALEFKNIELSNSIEFQKNYIAKLELEKTELLNKLESQNNKINKLEFEIKTYNENAISSERKISELQKSILNLNKENNKLQDAIGWYKRTYENRKLIGIIKDRIIQNKPSLSINFNKKLNLIRASKLNKYKTKIKPAKIKNEVSKRILCTIVNYNFNENALKLRNTLSKYFDSVVIDSGSKLKDKTFVLLDNVYYSGLFNYAYQLAKNCNYEYLLFICSDVEIQDEQVELVINNLNNINLNEIGLYSPSSTGRSHFYCKKQYVKGLRIVPFVEGFMFLAHLDVLQNIAPIDLKINKFGWGLDVACGFFAKKLNKLCVIDDGVTVYHPEGTGYSDEFAEESMWKWFELFNDIDFKNFYTKQIEIIRLGLSDKNKISIIIPCYNQELYIKETIFSVLLHEYSNFEIIVVNDGSTDNSEGIILEFKNLFPQIKYIKKQNEGLGSTRNAGLQNISGDFVQFLDSDDLISTNKFLNQIYDFIHDPYLQISYSEYVCFEDGQKDKTWTYSRLIMNEDTTLDLIQNWETELSIPIHCFIFKASILNNLKFDEELPNHEDWEFHLRIASKKPVYKYQKDAIAYYRVRTTSMSRDKELMIKGRKMCLKKIIDSGIYKNTYLNELILRFDED